MFLMFVSFVLWLNRIHLHLFVIFIHLLYEMLLFILFATVACFTGYSSLAYPCEYSALAELNLSSFINFTMYTCNTLCCFGCYFFNNFTKTNINKMTIPEPNHNITCYSWLVQKRWYKKYYLSFNTISNILNLK